MKRVLYYCMLGVFFVCFVWNALSKRDSIMGTPAPITQTEQSDRFNELALISALP